MSSMRKYAVGLALLGALSAGSAHANLLTNGDFETGAVDNSANVPGWVTGNIGNNGPFHSVQLQYAGLVGWGPGQLVMFNTGDSPTGGTLSQSFGTVIGQSYTLSFDLGILNGGLQQVGVTVTGSGTDFSQLLPLGAQTTYSYSFTASAAISTLTFSDLSPSTFGGDGLLDNVSVTGPTPDEEPLPEPAALGLMLVGLGGAFALRRRG